jgi:hypothetical protein
MISTAKREGLPRSPPRGRRRRQRPPTVTVGSKQKPRDVRTAVWRRMNQPGHVVIFHESAVSPVSSTADSHNNLWGEINFGLFNGPGGHAATQDLHKLAIFHPQQRAG